MSDDKNRNQRYEHAYEQMLQRVTDALKKVEEEAAPRMRQIIDDARDFAIGVGELTRDEAEKISKWVTRDMQDAAKYLDKTGAEMRDWLKFDMELIEDRISSAMRNMIDYTQLELRKIQERAEAHGDIWRTGEVVGPGTLRCKSCGADMDFKKPGAIPPCPKCHKTEFDRPWDA